jgi:hypothetical protein
MTFQEYLTSKKIDAARFATHEPHQYAEWEREFGLLHPESFTAQKKFLINALRRRFLLAT